MELIDSFSSILEALLSENNELIQQAQGEYTEILNNNPVELAFIHFQIISTTENEQIRDLTLVLLGNYFSLLKQYKINIPPEDSNEIKSFLLLLLQNENFSQYNFGIISNIIFKSAQYFENDWPELSERLSELLNDPNPAIYSTAANCLSECINYSLINFDQYLDAFILFVQNFLVHPPDVGYIEISSILRLLYSIIKSIKYYHFMTLLIPIINLIPNFLIISQDDPTIINDFYFFMNTHLRLFTESYVQIFQIMTDIVSSEDFSSGIKNTAIFIINDLISFYTANFQENSTSIFDFFVSQIPQKEIHGSCYDLLKLLSQIYGGNVQFAMHIFGFFQSNIPDPITYIVMGASYEGISSHFSCPEFLMEILTGFEQGFSSPDDFVRLKAFQCFIPLVKVINFLSLDSTPLNELITISLQAIVAEQNTEVLFEEIKMLSKLLKNNADQIHIIAIQYIVELLDSLVAICTLEEFIFPILSCYKSIAIAIARSRNKEFLPFSEQLIMQISQYINNPQDSEALFFYCMKILPSFRFAIPSEVFVELMTNIFDFLFTIVYDENGNENESEDFSLSSYGQCSIIKFFYSCIFSETLDEYPEILEKIAMVSFNVASIDIEYELVNIESDISMYENYSVFSVFQEDKFLIVDNQQLQKVKNCLSILRRIFIKNIQMIEPIVDDLVELTAKLLDNTYYTQIYNSLYRLERLFVPFIEDNMQILKLLMKHLKNILTPDKENSEQFAKLISVFIKTVGVKWNEEESLIQGLYKFCYHLLRFVFIDSENDEQKAAAIQNVTFCDNMNTKINCALTFREMFRYFPMISYNNFQNIFNLVDGYQSRSKINKTVASIIYSDFIHFCPQENLDFFVNILDFLRQEVEQGSYSEKFESILGLSIIMTPNYIDIDLMRNFVDLFFACTQDDINNEVKTTVACALLQIFQNYSEVFDVSIFFPQFFEFLPSCIYQIPKYYLEYFVQSLIFFIPNFKDSIPEDQIEKFQIILQLLLLKKLDTALLEDLNSILSSLQNVE